MAGPRHGFHPSVTQDVTTGAVVTGLLSGQAYGPPRGRKYGSGAVKLLNSCGQEGPSPSGGADCDPFTE